MTPQLGDGKTEICTQVHLISLKDGASSWGEEYRARKGWGEPWRNLRGMVRGQQWEPRKGKRKTETSRESHWKSQIDFQGAGGEPRH